VTGSSGGIGRAIALGLASDGLDVAIHYRRSKAAAEDTRAAVEAFGVRGVALQADLTGLDDAGALVDEAHERLGGLDVLVNNVGNYVFRPWDELTNAEWRDVLASNLDATFATCRAAVALMRVAGSGRIVNLGYAGSLNLVARPSIVPYAIAKTGIVQLTRAIAKTEAANGITANVVAPGVIETSRTLPMAELPLGRPGTVDEVAEVVRFLVSPTAAYITGQVVEVAGGWNL
jgi:NAD(P)-dependent dehydrogenase (short-subunit alcohol dehydrogenase family)